jgi:hypothetical protein
MREKLLTALEAHAKGHIEKHRINIEVYLTNPVGIGEHGNIIETIEKVLWVKLQFFRVKPVNGGYMSNDGFETFVLMVVVFIFFCLVTV